MLAAHNFNLAQQQFPQTLFAAGEAGVWYDPSDLSTLFQDSAGTTPVTAVEQPVGKMLDKSGRGNHATQTVNANRPTLSARVNLLTDTATLATQSVSTLPRNYVLSFSGSGSIALSGTASGTKTAGSNTITCTSGTLTLTVTGQILNADLRPSNQVNTLMPTYQEVTSSTVYTTAGFPLYLRGNGVNTIMVFTTASFSTLGINVFTGWRDENPANTSIVIFSVGDSTSNVNNLTAGGTWQSGSFQTIGYRFPENQAISIGLGGSTTVVSYQRSSTTLQAARANGVNKTNNTNSTTTFSPTHGAILARIGGAQTYAGNLYQYIVRCAPCTASQIVSMENFVNSRSLAY